MRNYKPDDVIEQYESYCNHQKNHFITFRTHLRFGTWSNPPLPVLDSPAHGQHSLHGGSAPCWKFKYEVIGLHHQHTTNKVFSRACDSDELVQELCIGLLLSIN